MSKVKITDDQAKALHHLSVFSDFLTLDLADLAAAVLYGEPEKVDIIRDKLKKKFKEVKIKEGSFTSRGLQVGELVESKQKQYGNSVERTADILKVLYPDGMATEQYSDALLIVRVLDKLCRISQRFGKGEDLGGESPWQDLSGYGLLGWEKDDK